MERRMAQIERLADLASAINEEHRCFQGASGAASFAAHAIKAGELLIEAKARCPHGTWQAWLEENFEGPVGIAQAYMREAGKQPKRMCARRL